MRTFKHVSTPVNITKDLSIEIPIKFLHLQHIPNNSNGKCNGKSTNENLVWSGNANSRGSWTVGERTSTSIRVEPGIGTGADSNRKIQVSISLTSCKTIDDVWSVGWPVNTVQTLSLEMKLVIGFVVNYNTNCVYGRRYNIRYTKSIKLNKSKRF